MKYAARLSTTHRILKPSRFLLALLPLVIGLGSCTSASIPTTSSDTTTAQVATEGTPLDYTTYAEVLSTYVDEQGFVDYEGLQADRQGLDEFNAAIAAVTPETYATWSEADQIAYWMNAYNSLTLKAIIDQTPLKASIKDIVGVWRINKRDILSTSKTLNQIEHDTLRAQFNEPRLHAALVCAAVSCPPLRNEPFTGEQLNEQLDDQTLQFVSNPDTGVNIDKDNGVVYLSSIFQWYENDWIPTDGTDSGFTGSEAQRAVLNHISRYVSPEDQAYLTEGNYEIKYLDYDWSLNRQG
ncbi:MAG: DUF547 domain-containing protein [Cyanobacteria bacterium J06635_1]